MSRNREPISRDFVFPETVIFKKLKRNEMKCYEIIQFNETEEKNEDK